MTYPNYIQSAPAASNGKATGSYAAPGITSAVYYGRTGEVMQTATADPINHTDPTGIRSFH